MWYKALLAGTFLLAALPGTSTYKLNSYGFGSGGGSSSTGTYSLEGASGEVNGSAQSTGTYGDNPGFIQTQQANVPKISAFDNNSGIYYNKLHFVIDTQSNPTDATYALSISTTSDFSSNVFYVKTDMTLGATLTSANFQTYTAWGSGTGANIIGLSYGITYYLHATASQGKFTQSPFGPAMSATTANPSLTFNLTTSALSSPPFNVSLGTLTPGGSAQASTTNIDVGLTTNAANGANVYITSKNGALKSTANPTTVGTITSATADLSSAAAGYGAQNVSAGQTSGGPLTALSPYTNSGNGVGIVDTTNRGLYTTAGPIDTGAGVLKLIARADTTNVAATDYQDILTLIAAGNF